MPSTLAPPVSITPPSADLLTPNTRSEAEAAFYHNASYQTDSAGPLQPSTPYGSSSNASTSNYLAAAQAHGVSSGIPHPSGSPVTATVPTPRKDNTGDSYESVKGEEEGRDVFSHDPRQPPSRGTTSAILQKMASGEYNFSDSSTSVPDRRINREGERRTSPEQVKGREKGSEAGGTAAEPKPGGLQRHQSFQQEDMKHSIMYQYMQVPEKPNYGYSSTGGTPMYTG